VILRRRAIAHLVRLSSEGSCKRVQPWDSDVAPIKGVERGPAGEAEHGVRVTITRLTS